MNTSTAIWIGILSSATAAFIFALVGLVWRELIRPKLRAMRYTGLLVNGSWHGKPLGLVQEIYLIIEQSADQLSGMATFVSTDKTNIDHEPCRSFKISGFIKDGIVILNSLSERQNRIGIQAFLLKASGDGRELEGIFSFYTLRGEFKDKISDLRMIFYHDSCASQSPTAFPSLGIENPQTKFQRLSPRPKKAKSR